MRLFGIIGNQLTHSFSPAYFKEKFAKENISDADFRLFPLPSLSDLGNLVIDHPALCGFSVTIPYKSEIIPLLDSVDNTALTIGAVNVVKIKNNKLFGYNTDIYGFGQSLKPLLEAQHNRALILGTGGASKAVHFVLKNIGVDCLFVSRAPKEKNQISYTEVNEYVIKNHLLIVNTTPLGMYPNINTFPPINYDYISDKHLVYDLTYNPTETLFLGKAKERNAVIQNGLQMLHFQADRAWEIWNERK